MAEVNLSNTLAKRSRSADSRLSAGSRSITGLDGTVDTPSHASGSEIPSFLNQSYSDVRKKFEELEWRQRERISAGILAEDLSNKWAIETEPAVRARNRYMNIQAWANSRVHLKVPEGECDFINASPIVLKDTQSDEEYRYIATQGPRDGQFAEFWNMVFHETSDVAVIVMLTQTVEGGREKCAQYIPFDLESPTFSFTSVESDPFVDRKEDEQPDDVFSGTVTLTESSYNEDLRSKISKLELRVGSETKPVWHFLFAGWSDFNKPEGADRDALLGLTNFTAEKALSPNNSRIVHCSAGVGRTGTFIALDHLLRELRSGQLLNTDDETTDAIFDTVDQLREQRMMMVYNDIQYQFIHDVLREQARIFLGLSKPPSYARPQKIPKPSSASEKPELVPLSPNAIRANVQNPSGSDESKN